MMKHFALILLTIGLAFAIFTGTPQSAVAAEKSVTAKVKVDSLNVREKPSAKSKKSAL